MHCAVCAGNQLACEWFQVAAAAINLQGLRVELVGDLAVLPHRQQHAFGTARAGRLDQLHKIACKRRTRGPLKLGQPQCVSFGHKAAMPDIAYRRRLANDLPGLNLLFRILKLELPDLAD